jgi:carbonic anhydrase
MNSLHNISSKDSSICGCSVCLLVAPAPEVQPATSLSRRGFLGRAAIGAAASLLPVGAFNLTGAKVARAASSMTPDEALAEMIAGNKRYTDGALKSFDEDLAMLKQKTAEGQEPFAAVLSCADSRVPVELLFDQSIGHLFVTRVAGNIATAEMIASLEYGVAVLGSKAIMVLGHSSCGAVQAAIPAKEVPGQISALYSYIRPAVDQAGSDIDTVARANVKNQVHILREASPVFADYIKKKNLQIVGGFYDLASGKVEMLS